MLGRWQPRHDHNLSVKHPSLAAVQRLHLEKVLDPSHHLGLSIHHLHKPQGLNAAAFAQQLEAVDLWSTENLPSSWTSLLEVTSPMCIRPPINRPWTVAKMATRASAMTIRVDDDDLLILNWGGLCAFGMCGKRRRE
ncbi:LOW QUALITY PROTEIN: hypothetical protein V2J09_024040 [Rumex salicifolius]